DDLYPGGDYASLEETLDEYLAELPEKDMWGHPYAYVVSTDSKRFRLISGGADGNFEWDSRRIAGAPNENVRFRERLEDDLIFADGAFVQLPIQAKSKE